MSYKGKHIRLWHALAHTPPRAVDVMDTLGRDTHIPRPGGPAHTPTREPHPPPSPLTLLDGDQGDGVGGALDERNDVLLDHSGHLLAVHLQHDFAVVEPTALVADLILANVSDEREEAILCASLDVEAEVALGVARDEALVSLDAPVLLLERVRALGRLRHGCWRPVLLLSHSLIV